MKKKLRILFVIAIFILILGYFFYPLSFGNLVKDESDIIITYIKDTTANGKAGLESTVYKISSNTKEHLQLHNILKKYRYHRTLKTIIGNSGLEGNDAGYTFIIHTDNSIIISGTGEVLVNARSYDVDYFGNNKSIAMMKEIKEIINQLKPLQQND